MAVKAPPAQDERRALDLAAGGVHDQVRDEQKDRHGARQEHGATARRVAPRAARTFRTSRTTVDDEDSDDEAACGRV